MAKTILGISPGTRIIGIAIMQNGELIDYRVKCFKYRWTKAKQSRILAYIEKLIEYYEVRVVVLKFPDPTRSSRQLEYLKEQIREMIKRKRVRTYSYATVTVKLGLGIKGTNKNGLLTHIAELYPELRKIYLKEINNRHSYYNKMFEAIAIAKWREIESGVGNLKLFLLET